jgi:hypothetical protein
VIRESVLENVENYEITWKQGLISMAFSDLFGNGEEYQFTPEDMAKVRDGITEALSLYWEDFPASNDEKEPTPRLDSTT